jgi:hypothetical protein
MCGQSILPYNHTPSLPARPATRRYPLWPRPSEDETFPPPVG